MRALRGLARAVLCWRWWAIAAALELCLALPPALFWHEWLRGALAGRYAPGELVRVEVLGSHDAASVAFAALI